MNLRRCGRGAPEWSARTPCVVLGALAMWAALSGPVQAQGTARAAAWAATVTYVVDGDSIWVRSTERGSRVKLRLLGIDAPEICQDQGPEARAALLRWALNRPVRVTVRARDPYGRALATVERVEDGLDLSQAMVAGGWAWVDRYRKHAVAYEADEDAARAAGRGVFARAAMERPADFRKRHGPCTSAKR